jgi:hypothetical protein
LSNSPFQAENSATSIEVLKEKELWPMTQGYPYPVSGEEGFGCDERETCCIE